MLQKRQKVLARAPSTQDPKRATPEKSWLTCLFGSPQKLSCTFHDRGGARSRSAADIAHPRRL